MDVDSDAVMTSASGATTVYNLYQEGLAPDQMLQLCFLRRRAPRQFRLDRTRIEDEFVLPRLELKMTSFLPSVHTPLKQLMGFEASPLSAASCSIADHSIENFSLDQVRDSAKTHYVRPQQAALEDVRQWAALAESDWITISQSVQRSKPQLGQDEAMTAAMTAAHVPDIVDICWMLEHCHSDAFTSFVWNHLLLSLVQQCTKDADSMTHQRLLTLLVSRHALAALSPKYFRAKLRSRNLRQVGNVLGTKTELARLSTTKANHLLPGANIALVVRRTSSVTRRPNYINIHRFWDRRPGNSHNRRLDIGIGDSEVLTESNRKCLLQCGRLRTIKR